MDFFYLNKKGHSLGVAKKELVTLTLEEYKVNEK